MRPRMLFPTQGRPHGEIAVALTQMREKDADWRGGRVPLFVFGALPEVADVGRDAFMTYFSENALGARRAFKSSRAYGGGGHRYGT